MRLPPSTYLQKQFLSPSPGTNIKHCQEDGSTDMIKMDTPALPGGFSRAHVFYGTTTRITDIFRADTDSPQDFLGAYQDRVCACGAPQRLIADNASLYRGWCIT